MKKVTENIYRGGALNESGLDEFKPATIINLENNFIAVNNEKNYCFLKNIRFYNIPMSEFFPPKVKQLYQCVDLLSNPSIPKPIYIHCLHGVDRTGFAIAAYRILVQHWTFEKAYQECLDMGHHVFWYWWWKRSLKKLNG